MVPQTKEVILGRTSKKFQLFKVSSNQQKGKNGKLHTLDGRLI
jgi:hypothetical protein